MYSVGIIGLGNIGIGADGRLDNHLQAYIDCPEIEIIATCDNNHPAVLALRDSPFPTPFVNYMRMVQEKTLDIVSVCTPVETHCQIVCDIAPYVKAIYCEKPIALTLEEADRMIQACHKHGVILQVNHQRRFMPVKARFSRGMLNTGTHMFDRLRQLFGEMTIVNGKFFFGKQEVEIEYLDSKEHIFEIDCTRSSERMILRGVEHLVQCLKEGKQSILSGEEARKTLEAVLTYENHR